MLISLVFVSCGISKDEENGLKTFYKYNYEFAKEKSDYNRWIIEKMRAESKFAVEKPIYNRINKADIMFNGVLKKINICLNHDSYDSVFSIYDDYNVFLDTINVFLENDKNYLIERVKNNFHKGYPELFVLRMKNDLMFASANYHEFIATNSDVGCGGWGYSRDIDAVSSIDNLGNTVIILNSKAFQNLDGNGVYNALIIDEISSNGVEIENEYFITENRAFANISMKSLKKGSYTLKGKMKLYGRKGALDYPFEHKFKVE
jgi:hypothetical protein